MSSPTCALSILVARTDVSFMMHTIPHLVRMCNFPFLERTLFVDTAPLSGDKVNRPDIGTMEQLRDYCNTLLQDGVVDRVMDVEYSDTYQRQIYRKHLGSGRICPTHNYKGYPIYGTIYSLEQVKGDYVLHFDSDMLLYQHPSFTWIETAIELMEQYPNVITMRPLAGPPHPEGLKKETGFELCEDKFYQFKTFGSRTYLLNRQRFDQFLPLPVLWRPFYRSFLNALPEPAKTWVNFLTGKGKLASWEVMFTNRLQASDYVRANLADPRAWTLHPIARGEAYINALPRIIGEIEAGWYPPEQAGDYDLQLDAWLDALATEDQRIQG
jgi:hypothetical protein